MRCDYSHAVVEPVTVTAFAYRHAGAGGDGERGGDRTTPKPTQCEEVCGPQFTKTDIHTCEEACMQKPNEAMRGNARTSLHKSEIDKSKGARF